MSGDLRGASRAGYPGSNPTCNWPIRCLAHGLSFAVAVLTLHAPTVSDLRGQTSDQRADSLAGTALPMADSSVSSEPAGNSAATRGLEPFFPLAASGVRRRCLVAVANCFPLASIPCAAFPLPRPGKRCLSQFPICRQTVKWIPKRRSARVGVVRPSCQETRS